MISHNHITEEMLESLREKVKLRMSMERFEHTVGVESAAKWLGSLIMPERVNELRAAAILHDVTKELDVDEQIDLIESCEYIDKQDRCTEAALHSFSAVAVIINEFADFASKDILDAVMFHTLGDPSMSMFAEIIYLSDYIEHGRTYNDCVAVRSQIERELSYALTQENREMALHRAVFVTIERTVMSVISRGKSVDPRTLKTKIAIEALI